MITGNAEGSGALTAERIQMFWNTNSTTGHDDERFYGWRTVFYKALATFKSQHTCNSCFIQAKYSEKKLWVFWWDTLNVNSLFVLRLQKWAQETCMILYSPVWFPLLQWLAGWKHQRSVPSGLARLCSPLAWQRNERERVEGYSHRPLEQNDMLGVPGWIKSDGASKGIAIWLGLHARRLQRGVRRVPERIKGIFR